MKKTITKILLTSIILLGFGNINQTNADYTRNINDEIKVYNIQKKVEKLFLKNGIEKNKIIKNKVKEKIEKVLGKSQNEILKKDLSLDKNFDSFREYLLLKIYDQLNYGIRNTGEPKIVENNFVKALTFEDKNDKIITTSNAFYTKSTNSKMVEFFYIPDGMSTEKFLENKFIKGKYDGKCKISENKKYYGTSYGIPQEGTYEIYANEINKKEQEKIHGKYSMIAGIGDCGEYGQTNGVQYFKKIGKNILMFASPGQSGIPIDLATIEVKSNINLAKDKIVKDFGNGLIVKIRGNKSFLYKENRILYIGDAIGESTSFSQVEEGKSGIYVLIRLHNGFSELLKLDKWGNKIILQKGNPDAGEGKTIAKFELMYNKKIKIFYYAGGSKILNIK